MHVHHATNASQMKKIVAFITPSSPIDHATTTPNENCSGCHNKYITTLTSTPEVYSGHTSDHIEQTNSVFGRSFT